MKTNEEVQGTISASVEWITACHIQIRSDIANLNKLFTKS